MKTQISKQPSQRQMMMARTIQEIISTALLREDLLYLNIRSDLISISDVKITPDLHYVTILLIIRNDLSVNPYSYIKTLNNDFAYKARKLIAKSISTKYTPNIKFALDESFEEISKINNLLNNIEEKSEKE